MINTIIITYNYKPQNITSAQRPFAWVKYLNEFDIYPIIITKNWKSDITDEVEIEETMNYKVVRINTDLILKERHAEVKGVFGKLLRSFFRLFHLFFYSSFKYGPNRDFYNITKKVLDKLDNPKILIVTAMPYGLLKVGYKLHKDTGIDWIADYRDDWTTSEIPEKNLIKRLLLKSYYKSQEIKWVSTSSMIMSVSNHYVDKILKLINFSSDKGHVIENGYFKDDFPLKHKRSLNAKEIKFLYVGSLYDSQDLMPLIKALNKAVIYLKKRGDIKFIFLGTDLNIKRQNKFIKAAPEVKFIFHKRMPKQEALKIQNGAQYAIMCPHKGLKGIPSSKLYEFVGSEMPVIYYPNDHDIINETLRSCNLGFTTENEKNLIKLFKDAIEFKLDYKDNNKDCHRYSREYSTEKLAKIIKELLNKNNNE